MSTFQHIRSLLIVAGTILLTVSCKKDDIPTFEGTPAINFINDTLTYSFLGNAADEYIQEVPVLITGDTAGYDRHFEVEVIQDSITTATPDQYEILEGLVKAGEFTGTLSIRLHNAPELSSTQIGIRIRLINSADFNAGNIETSTFIVRWTDKVVVPAWTYYRYFFTSTASTSAYRAIVESTGYTTFTLTQYRALGTVGAQAVGTKFGDFVKQWNLDHPNDHLKHDDGSAAGQDIVPLYYSHAKYD